MKTERTYLTRAARDAQSANYGDERYWEYLERLGVEHHDYFMRRGLSDRAAEMFTQTLSEALQGNNGG